MVAFTLRRLMQAVVLLLALSFLTFTLMGLMPGDPLDIACAANPRCTPENLEQMKKNLGLDQPISVRYYDWLRSALQGDLGYSRTYRQPVTDILLPRLFNTIILGTLALLVSVLIAIPLGVFVSLRQNSKWDYGINLLAFIGISSPSFWLGLMLIFVFSVSLGWFPVGGIETIGSTDSMSFFDRIVDRLKYLALPTAALSLLTIASWVRYTRASMLEVLRMDYVRTARAKGLPRRAVIRDHAFRNALLPIVTICGLSIPGIFSGAVITETVFSYQGVGKLTFDSIIGNDFNVAMCSFILSCVSVLVASLATDLVYAWLDPRIKYE